MSSRSTDTTDTSALQCVCAQANEFLKTATSTPTGNPLVHQRTDTMYSKSQEGSVPLLLSGPCRLCVKSPVAKKTVTVRVTRQRVHTRNKNATRTVSGTQGSSCRHALQSYPRASPLKLGLCDSTMALGMGDTVFGTIVDVPMVLSFSSVPSNVLSIPSSSSASVPQPAHIHTQPQAKRMCKKVRSDRKEVLDQSHAGAAAHSKVVQTQKKKMKKVQLDEEKQDFPELASAVGDEKCSISTLKSKVGVPVMRSTNDERKSLFFPASSSSAQNSESQSEDSSMAKAQQMGLRSEVGGSSELSSHQMALRG